MDIVKPIEFLPLAEEDINPFLTPVKIKVFHLGKNRNGSYISKETAIKMGKTLRGNPIVAHYSEKTGDFQEHDKFYTINKEGEIVEKSLTRPYGFVDLKAEIWFEDFDDINEQGEVEKHTYLLTQGYLWTELYEELKGIESRPQSMELDEKTLDGDWVKNPETKKEFFIINDAVITKLCMLGRDYEPCFPSADVTFSLTEQDSFIQELIEFKNRFSKALQEYNRKESLELESNIKENVVTDDAATDFVKDSETTTTDFVNDDSENTTTNFTNDAEPEDISVVATSVDLVEENKNLTERIAYLEADNQTLSEMVTELKQFKLEAERREKDELINSFYMLSDEDKADVIENKDRYSLREIKAELSMLCVDKKLNLAGDLASAQNTAVVYSLNGDKSIVDNTPAWLKAVEKYKN